MARIGFDNQKYLETQSARIRERIDQFGGKLYLEFGGKLFDDYHASRVLPWPTLPLRLLPIPRLSAKLMIWCCASSLRTTSLLRWDA